MRTKSSFLLLGAAALACLLPVRVLTFAAPDIILFHGPPLAKPVITTGFERNSVLMHAITQPVSISRDTLKDRPFVEVAMFWGLDWHQYLVQGKRLDGLKPDQANQHGRIYLATADAPALFVFDDTGQFGRSAAMVGLVRWITDDGLAMLKKHGVPTAVIRTH
jgi:hypothetical protein